MYFLLCVLLVKQWDVLVIDSAYYLWRLLVAVILSTFSVVCVVSEEAKCVCCCACFK